MKTILTTCVLLLGIHSAGANVSLRYACMTDNGALATVDGNALNIQYPKERRKSQCLSKITFDEGRWEFRCDESVLLFVDKEGVGTLSWVEDYIMIIGHESCTPITKGIL